MVPYSPLSRDRLLIVGGFYAAAVAAGVTAWRHAAEVGAAPFLCGGAAGDAHCWACYAAPMLAAAGLAVLMAPDFSAAPARR